MSQTVLKRRGNAKIAVDSRLTAAGDIYAVGRALMFASTKYGDDLDRAVQRSDGATTYFGSDTGYLLHKAARGYDRLIYIWGADHHGTIARLRGAAKALGISPSVEVLLVAWVRLVP